MAAYAALLSLEHTIEHLQNHPHPPISLPKSQIRSLTQNLTLFQDFLENYSLNSDGFESRIADAAHEAEDLIESHVVDEIQARSLDPNSSYDESLFQGLQRVMESMNFIAKDVKETMKEKVEIRRDRPRLNPPPSASGSLRSPPMVGFDDVMIDVMDKLTCHSTGRRVITVTGMGGMGKTTLSRNVFTNPLVEQHFDILSWATISQDYCLKEILLEFLVCAVKHQVSKEHFHGKSEDDLRILLHKALSGRRYLVVMDDVWSLDTWDEMKFFFPENNNGSRVIVTTRLSNVAFQLSDDSSHCIKMNFLDKDQSWNLLSKTVFGEEDIRPGGFVLEEIGKKIAENCRGLPLSIVVIGGLLAKSEQTKEYWLHVAENLNSIVNSEENDEHCFKILHMSYHHLPIHLKPCFLYMGSFQEDAKIRVSSLIKLWISEGFVKVKPVSGESSEIIALHYLKELTDRNLLSVHEHGPAGNMKICMCHDLLRDLCVKEARKQKFLNFINLDDTSADTSNNRRVCFAKSIPRYSFSTYDMPEPKIPNPEAKALLLSPRVRSLICDSLLLVSSVSSKLLRVLKADDRLSLPFYDSPKDIFGLVNVRLLDVRVNWHQITDNYLSSLHLLWNLQTLIVDGPNVTLPNEFWNMTRLRHVKFRRLELPEPSGTDLVVLGHLQTLKTVCNLKFSEEVVKRIPNIKKLKLANNNDSEWCLENIGRLDKLESLHCVSSRKIEFPSQLKKLTLQGNKLCWEDEMMMKIGSLPDLEVLKLKGGSFVGPVWETVEGHFCSLKFLLIEQCLDLEWWNTESSHFPMLERLVLRYLGKLREIPLGIGDITTLKSIELEYCSDLVVVSANKILKEQEEMGNEDLQVRIQVLPWEKSNSTVKL